MEYEFPVFENFYILSNQSGQMRQSTMKQSTCMYYPVNLEIMQLFFSLSTLTILYQATPFKTK
jgi:hypothetical protein